MKTQKPTKMKILTSLKSQKCNIFLQSNSLNEHLPFLKKSKYY